jgi:hypothetical protein
MPALLELQRAFGAALADAGRAGLAAPLFRGGRERTLSRLAVYRGNFYVNCTNALAGAHPIVRKIVGGDFFDAMARAYARIHPSTSGDLNEYGEQFAEFVAAFPHTQDLPYLPDVARMEWHAHRAYYAADATPFAPARLASLPPERWAGLRLTLAPACALLASDWPLARIWAVHQDGFEGGVEVDFEVGSDRILIHRPLWKVEVRTLPAGDYRFLASARAGAALGDALAAAMADDAEFDAATGLARWVEAGVVIDLAMPAENR